MRPSVVIALLVVSLTACGGGKHTATRPGPKQCAEAWNAADNAANRKAAVPLILSGFGSARIELWLNFGPPRPWWVINPNPVGCFVVFFNGHWSARFVARRDGSEFRFVMNQTPRRFWMKDQPPDNATADRDAHVRLRG